MNFTSQHILFNWHNCGCEDCWISKAFQVHKHGWINKLFHSLLLSSCTKLKPINQHGGSMLHTVYQGNIFCIFYELYSIRMIQQERINLIMPVMLNNVLFWWHLCDQCISLEKTPGRRGLMIYIKQISILIEIINTGNKPIT